MMHHSLRWRSVWSWVGDSKMFELWSRNANRVRTLLNSFHGILDQRFTDQSNPATRILSFLQWCLIEVLLGSKLSLQRQHQYFHRKEHYIAWTISNLNMLCEIGRYLMWTLNRSLCQSSDRVWQCGIDFRWQETEIIELILKSVT
jgi:hypothetical protein